MGEANGKTKADRTTKRRGKEKSYGAKRGEGTVIYWIDNLNATFGIMLIYFLISFKAP